MGMLQKIKQHAENSAGNFASMFRGFEIPPLPAATNQLLAELRQPEPDVKRLLKVISTSPELAAKVIRTVNSSLFALRQPVSSVQHAIALLGLRHIRAIALCYTVKSALPTPESKLFDHETFWSDSLMKALLARSFTRRRSSREAEEAFTATLLADLAIPVLLNFWESYYEPVMEDWRDSTERLSHLERQAFGWDHAQAGSWILKFWQMPDELTCFVATHNLQLFEIENLGLEDSIAVPMAVASMTPSALKSDPIRAAALVAKAREVFLMTEAGIGEMLDQVQVELDEACQLFEIENRQGAKVIAEIRSVVEAESVESP